MKKFFIMLILGKTILLTENPITVSNDYLLIELEESIEAVTEGASFLVDVTNMFPSAHGGKVSVVRRKVYKRLESSVIVANLKNDNDKAVFTYEGGVLIGENRVLIRLVSEEVLIGKSWSKIEIRSSIDLKNVKLLWKNYEK